MRELFQKCRELTQENQEIPILRDSLEEMKYLQSKVVSVTSCTFSGQHKCWLKEGGRESEGGKGEIERGGGGRKRERGWEREEGRER